MGLRRRWCLPGPGARAGERANRRRASSLVCGARHLLPHGTSGGPPRRRHDDAVRPHPEPGPGPGRRPRRVSTAQPPPGGRHCVEPKASVSVTEAQGSASSGLVGLTTGMSTPSSRPTSRIVTVSATYGSGGSVVAPQLAKRLGLPFADRLIPARGSTDVPSAEEGSPTKSEIRSGVAGCSIV